MEEDSMVYAYETYFVDLNPSQYLEKKKKTGAIRVMWEHTKRKQEKREERILEDQDDNEKYFESN